MTMSSYGTYQYFIAYKPYLVQSERLSALRKHYVNFLSKMHPEQCKNSLPATYWYISETATGFISLWFSMICSFSHMQHVCSTLSVTSRKYSSLESGRLHKVLSTFVLRIADAKYSLARTWWAPQLRRVRRPVSPHSHCQSDTYVTYLLLVQPFIALSPYFLFLFLFLFIDHALDCATFSAAWSTTPSYPLCSWRVNSTR